MYIRNQISEPLASDRIFYMDTVRAFALILGIVFHSGLSFLPIYIGWAVMDISTSPIISDLLLVFHSFRMPLFFLVAGFFGCMSAQKKGMQNFLYARLLRICIPLVIGWILLRPILISMWIVGAASMRGDIEILEAFGLGVKEFLSSPEQILTGTHLWFLYYLLLATICAFLIRYTISKFSTFEINVTRTLGHCVTFLSKSSYSVVFLAMPTMCCLWFMEQWGLDTPDKSLIPDIPIFTLYLGSYLFGGFLFNRKSQLHMLSRITPFCIVLCIVSTYASIYLIGYQSQAYHPHYKIIKVMYNFSYSVMMWSYIWVVIGAFRRYFDRPNNFIRYIADSSYWMYLIHLPIVIFFQILFAEFQLFWVVKWVLVSILTIFISLLIYDAIIRSTVIGFLLNGRKKSRILFKHA